MLGEQRLINMVSATRNLKSNRKTNMRNKCVIIWWVFGDRYRYAKGTQMNRKFILRDVMKDFREKQH